MARVLVLSEHVVQLDRRIVSQANAMARWGHEVVLLSVPTHIPPGCLDARVEVVMGAGGAGDSTSWKRLLVERLPDAMLDGLRSLYYRWGDPAGRVSRYFERHWPEGEFDLFHCHDLPTVSVAVARRERGPGRPRILYDSHELYPEQFPNKAYCRYWGEVEGRLIHEVDAVVTVNDSIAEEMVRRYGVVRPHVLHNSYDLPQEPEPVSEAEFLAHFGSREKGFAVIFQGFFQEGRNLEALVEAFAEFRDDTRLYLLGGGPHEARVRAAVARLGLENVFLGGWVEQERLLAFTRHADLGVIPYLGAGTLNDRLCTPNKLFEYLAVGVPMVASKLPEFTRIVEGSRIGLVRPMVNAVEIAAAIREGRAAVEAGSFGAEAFVAARERYGWPAQEAALREVVGVVEEPGTL